MLARFLPPVALLRFIFAIPVIIGLTLDILLVADIELELQKLFIIGIQANSDTTTQKR